MDMVFFKINQEENELFILKIRFKVSEYSKLVEFCHAIVHKITGISDYHNLFKNNCRDGEIFNHITSLLCVDPLQWGELPTSCSRSMRADLIATFKCYFCLINV